MSEIMNKLAAEIRRVDGDHTLGAGALAEALTPFVLTLAADILINSEMAEEGYDD